MKKLYHVQKPHKHKNRIFLNLLHIVIRPVSCSFYLWYTVNKSLPFFHVSLNLVSYPEDSKRFFIIYDFWSFFAGSFFHLSCVKHFYTHLGKFVMVPHSIDVKCQNKTQSSESIYSESFFMMSVHKFMKYLTLQSFCCSSFLIL